MPGARFIVDRRLFLKRVIKTFFAILSVISAGLLALVVAPSRIRKKTTTFIDACAADALPVRGVRQYYVKYSLHDTTVTAKIFIVNTGSDLFALSPVCTHLGCLVNWNRHRSRFLCPCHGGAYDIEGTVIEGPPPAPLHRLPLRWENDRVLVGLRI